jgi:hypothetical protein
VSRGRAWLLRFALGAGLLAVAGAAVAKPARHKTTPRRPTPAPAAKRAPPPSPAARPDSTSSSETATASDTGDTGDSAAAPTNGLAPGTKVKTKTYTFGAMDVEGKLKTPQLLYFLNRVKLELDMSAPDKRSFMKELAQSADDKSL